jgi:hypothetical protein
LFRIHTYNCQKLLKTLKVKELTQYSALAIGCMMRDSGVHFPAEVRDYSFLQTLQASSEAYLVS